jgi:hypothetical protein
MSGEILQINRTREAPAFLFNKFRQKRPGKFLLTMHRDGKSSPRCHVLISKVAGCEAPNAELKSRRGLGDHRSIKTSPVRRHPIETKAACACSQKRQGPPCYPSRLRSPILKPLTTGVVRLTSGPYSTETNKLQPKVAVADYAAGTSPALGTTIVIFIYI